VLLARSADALEEVQGAIESAGGAADVRVGSVEDSAALGGIIEEVATTFGRLDVLVNNAGVTRDGLLMRMSDEDFDTVLSINLRSVFIACRAAARPMMRGKYGRIVNIGSVSGLMGNPGQANYSAAKAGLVGLTRSIARELGPKGVTANVVAPGFINTDMTAGLPDALKEEVKRGLPLRRFGEPAEIAHTVSFVASELAGYLTGQVITVDGGLSH